MSQFEPVFAQYGAPMGRPQYCLDETALVTVFKVRPVDGDYDDGGAYWGFGKGSQPLYCARDVEGDVQLFVRAPSLASAKLELHKEHPDLRFVEDIDAEFIDLVTEGFVEAMCWAESGDDDAPLGEYCEPGDLADVTLKACRSLCADFHSYCKDVGIELQNVALFPERIGHDFWLTQRHHGAGFWDRGLGELGQRLTDAAQTFSIEAYKGGDDLVYLSGYEHFEEQA